ncbi:DNA-binding transcription factor [Fragilaria crotonensis]|nr:DNA-binding transcription factor [Fragilaria crotonensis]
MWDSFSRQVALSCSLSPWLMFLTKNTMVVPAAKHPSVNWSSADEIRESKNHNDCSFAIHDKAKKRGRDDFSSMEPDRLSTLSNPMHEERSRADSGVLSSTPAYAFHPRNFLVHNHTKVPQSVTTVGSKASSADWSPLPFQDSRRTCSRPEPLQHSYGASESSRIVATSLSEISFLEASSSFMFDYGSFVVPPSLVSRASSKCCLLGQPLIQSPAPITFLSSNRSAGSSVRRYLSSTTPLSENTFHPTMFSVDSTSSGRTPYSDNAGALFRCASGDDSVHQVLASAQHRELTALERTGTVFCATDKVKNKVAVNTELEAATSFSNAHLANATPTRSHHNPRLHASKMLLFAAVRRAAEEDNDSENELETLFCTCPKSKCLKLYCVCFQRAILCDKSSCKCTNCKNTTKHAGPNGARTMAIASISKRRQNAFGKREKQVGLGCSCKRNKCLKKYCACYSEGIPCDDDKCGCVDCQNEARSSACLSGSPLSMGSEICPV